MDCKANSLDFDALGGEFMDVSWNDNVFFSA